MDGTITIKRRGFRKGSGGYRVDADPRDCTIWQGNINQNGYGRVWVEGPDGKRALRYAHRVAWEAWRFPIPEGMTIDHLCAQPACVNPMHLDLVTFAENSRRADARVTHCPKGHEYTPENTAITSQGNRSCRQCHRDREAARRRRSAPVTCKCGAVLRYGNLRRHLLICHIEEEAA